MVRVPSHERDESGDFACVPNDQGVAQASCGSTEFPFVPLSLCNDDGAFGSKAVALAQISRIAEVPPGYVLNSSWVEAFTKSEGDISHIVQSLSSKLRFADFLAVRSSAIDEDLASGSKAGKYESNIILNKDLKLDRSIRHVVESLSVTHGGVIVQAVPMPTVSGVLVSFRNSTPAPIVIEANWGLCSYVTEGLAGVDRFMIDDEDRITTRIMGYKRHQYLPLGPGVMLASVERSCTGISSLTSGQIWKLLALRRNLTPIFGAHIDIEWTFSKKNVLYALQARLATT